MGYLINFRPIRSWSTHLPVLERRLLIRLRVSMSQCHTACMRVPAFSYAVIFLFDNSIIHFGLYPFFRFWLNLFVIWVNFIIIC